MEEVDAVMEEVDAVMDVVRGRVTNGLRARRCLAVVLEVEVRGPAPDVRRGVRGRRPPRKWFADDTYSRPRRSYVRSSPAASASSCHRRMNVRTTSVQTSVVRMRR
jgi:hypothetical protein